MNPSKFPKLPASKLLFDARSIDAMNQTLGRQISEHYGEHQSEGLLLLSVLTGAMMFTSDLMRYINIPLRLDCVRVSRYHNQTHGSHLDWHSRPNAALQGQKVLLVDDIFDEGKTMAELHRFCLSEGASDVRSAVLLDKRHDRRSVDYVPDFIGSQCPDEYVFGYGMDLEGQFRHLPEIYHLIKTPS